MLKQWKNCNEIQNMPGGVGQASICFLVFYLNDNSDYGIIIFQLKSNFWKTK